MESVFEKIEKTGIIPVIKISEADKAIPLAEALCDGGLPAAEVTFRTDAAADAIKLIRGKFPHMTVGAGTVLTAKQVDAAVSAGAEFIVSPGLNPKVVSYCIDVGVPVIPGCSSPSDIETAIELGLDTVKFFPAEAAGGVAMIKAMSAPYSGVKFMPTGGIDLKNLNDYLGFDKVIACGGSFMVKEDYIKNGEWDKIRSLTQTAVQTMLGFELSHIGINGENEKEAVESANLFSRMFMFETKAGRSSVFCGNGIEIMKKPYLGKNGHIAIGTNSVLRAVNYLESKGFAFKYDSAKYDAKGKLTSIYFDTEISGFAIHLVNKK